MSHPSFGSGTFRKPQLTPEQIGQLDELNVSSYTYGILRRTRTTVAELLCMTRRDVMDLRGMGPGRCRELQLALEAKGFQWPAFEEPKPEQPAESVGEP